MLDSQPTFPTLRKVSGEGRAGQVGRAAGDAHAAAEGVTGVAAVGSGDLGRGAAMAPQGGVVLDHGAVLTGQRAAGPDAAAGGVRASPAAILAGAVFPGAADGYVVLHGHGAEDQAAL